MDWSVNLGGPIVVKRGPTDSSDQFSRELKSRLRLEYRFGILMFALLMLLTALGYAALRWFAGR